MSQFRKIIAAKKRATKAKDAKSMPAAFVVTDEYKNKICEHAYLGKKGYTIPKIVIEEEDMAFLKTDLYVKPESNSAVFGIGLDEPAFAVFRENTAKIYIPRFYGIERYGQPRSSEIDEGLDINVQFPNPLRDYQDKIVGVYVDHVSTAGGGHRGGGILEVPCGRGKCLAKDTPILMYDGTICPVQDLHVGDIIMGDDSGPRTILSLASGREMMYRICGDDGESYVVNESHILSLQQSDNTIVDISLSDYLDLKSDSFRGYRVPIDFAEKRVISDPYSIGRCVYNLDNIPFQYIWNSRGVRMQLLAGILDSYGYYRNNTKIKLRDTKNVYYIKIPTPIEYFDQSFPSGTLSMSFPGGTLESEIVYLVRSLGFPIRHLGNKLAIYGTSEIPVKIIKRLDNKTVDNTYSIHVEPIGLGDYYGFEIDGNRRFVLGDFTVTHNTIMALKIISIIQKKTLIVVHKEFLMNQWIERIRDFLPGAKVGKIQGKIMDVAGKDIVIGMIQTLYDKEYPLGIVEQFGLTIVDEVHRIGSEQFSKTLLKTLTPCMLGISATVDRKDKLTKVLYMFIGPKIYTEKREDDDCVCVRAIVYHNDDVEFNQVEHDFRGNTKYSTMIVKLCEFGPRSDFIVSVIADLIAENPENQIMVLGHNRSLLTYLYEAIVHRQIAPVGYYVGGMKQEALQLTETKQIVLATYAMAAEALDIKTLSTLVMITPKTDIIQSVGRILRVKHENPIVVDIVDSHDLFQKQWVQRRRFYKSCNYRIRQIGSRDYSGMQLDWNQDKTWKRVYEPFPKSTNVTLNDHAGDAEPATNALAGNCAIDIAGLDFG